MTPLRRLLVAILAVVLVAPSGASATGSAADEIQDALWRYGDTSGAWSGADGAYSVPLPDGRTAWLFSDTFLGPVDAESRTRPRDARLVNNTILVQDGETFTTLHGNGPFGSSALVGTEDQNLATWYWMGDGTVVGDALHVFVLRFTRPIQQLTNDVATFRLPDMTFEGVTRLPLGMSPAAGATLIGWGAAVLERPDATYIYGLEDLHAEKYLHLARAPGGDLFAPWEYWTGTAWSPNPLLSARLLSGISNEFSVQVSPGGFTLVAQDHGINPDVIACHATAPQGPWGDCRTVFTTPETAGSIFTYNAKAHPQLGDADTLVVSYNVNTSVYDEHFTNIDIYRPRFVAVPLPDGF